MIDGAEKCRLLSSLHGRRAAEPRSSPRANRANNKITTLQEAFSQQENDILTRTGLVLIGYGQYGPRDRLLHRSGDSGFVMVTHTRVTWMLHSWC